MTQQGSALFGLLSCLSPCGSASPKTATFPSLIVSFRNGSWTLCSSKAFPSCWPAFVPDPAGLPSRLDLVKQRLACHPLQPAFSLPVWQLLLRLECFLPLLLRAASESFGANTAGGSWLSPGALRLLHSCSVRQFLWPSGLRPRRPLRFIGPGYVCLYAGNRGVAKEVMKLGSILWAATFDWKHGSGQDLLDPSLQELLISAAEAHCFCAAGLAPICASFSTAITPPVRTSQHPSGIPLLLPAMALKVSQGNAHCSFVVRFVRVLLKLGVPFWLENPDCSWLWRQPEFLALLEDFPHLVLWRYDCCRFGSPWRKRARVLTTTELAGSTTLCNGATST